MLFEKIAITGIQQKAQGQNIVPGLLDILKDYGCTIFLDPKLGVQSNFKLPSLFEKCIIDADLVIILGGDGTFLRTARSIQAYNIPLLGINQGGVGFLADLTPSHLTEGLIAVLNGEFTEQERPSLSIQVGDRQAFAINECLLSQEHREHMISSTLYIDGHFVCQQRGDGWLIATPTGSTAYALSAGGPILLPSVHAHLALPLCAHSLSLRPLVIPATSEMEFYCSSRHTNTFKLLLDGQETIYFHGKESVKITDSRLKTKFLHPKGYDFFKSLGTKLGWASPWIEGENK